MLNNQCRKWAFSATRVYSRLIYIKRKMKRLRFTRKAEYLTKLTKEHKLSKEQLTPQLILTSWPSSQHTILCFEREICKNQNKENSLAHSKVSNIFWRQSQPQPGRVSAGGLQAEATVVTVVHWNMTSEPRAGIWSRDRKRQAIWTSEHRGSHQESYLVRNHRKKGGKNTPGESRKK